MKQKKEREETSRDWGKNQISRLLKHYVEVHFL